jgi:hypothetical protein
MPEPETPVTPETPGAVLLDALLDALAASAERRDLLASLLGVPTDDDIENVVSRYVSNELDVPGEARRAADEAIEEHERDYHDDDL